MVRTPHASLPLSPLDTPAALARRRDHIIGVLHDRDSRAVITPMWRLNGASVLAIGVSTLIPWLASRAASTGRVLAIDDHHPPSERPATKHRAPIGIIHHDLAQPALPAPITEQAWDLVFVRLALGALPDPLAVALSLAGTLARHGHIVIQEPSGVPTIVNPDPASPIGTVLGRACVAHAASLTPAGPDHDLPTTLARRLQEADYHVTQRTLSNTWSGDSFEARTLADFLGSNPDHGLDGFDVRTLYSLLAQRRRFLVAGTPITTTVAMRLSS